MDKTSATSKLVRWAVLLLIAAALLGSPGRAGAARLTLSTILQRTEAHYKKVRAYTAYFRQWTTSAAASTMKTEATGRVYYQNPRKMRWEYLSPEVQVFAANQDVAWLYVPAEKQISIIETEAFLSSPLARTFFDGVFELRKYFSVKLDSRESSDTTAVLRLTPKKEDAQVQSASLWIDLKKYRILIVESTDALGNVNRLMLQDQEELPRLDSKLFRLEVPPGTTVLDFDGRQLSPEEIKRLTH